jgi:hypothetical protein
MWEITRLTSYFITINEWEVLNRHNIWSIETYVYDVCVDQSIEDRKIDRHIYVHAYILGIQMCMCMFLWS